MRFFAAQLEEDRQQMEAWNADKSAELFGIRNWGSGYFDINSSGNVVVRPEKNGLEIDLANLVARIVERGIEAPILIRFDGILRSRVRTLKAAFDEAIDELGYSNTYFPAYPIKVNQQSHVVDSIISAGREVSLSLEVGSKPELLAVLALQNIPNGLILCNGYKDREYIELALMAQKLGRRPMIIIERLAELELVLETANDMNEQFEIGFRMKPVGRGAGKWESSSGDTAKFGLSTPEIIEAVNILRRCEKLDSVKLLHFHIGSQITAIGAIKRALKEACRVFTELRGMCPALEFFDVGGGLAVDYDGSRTSFESSANYSLGEYARDVVYAIQQACEEAEVPAPCIISESGRALVAHHSVLITQIIDTATKPTPTVALDSPPSDHETLAELYEMFEELSVKNCHETLNDVLILREELVSRFTQGDINLEERAYADRAYWQILAKISGLAKELSYVPEDLRQLDAQFCDTYYANFSVFQSLPDSWAVGQLFPVMPISKHKSKPTRRAVLADISCDSDGKVDRFVDQRSVKHYLQVHELDGSEPYYMGIFLVGAYQETLGDLHNLFGDTNAVHIEVREDGSISFDRVVRGDTVRDVLKYVEFNAKELEERLRLSLEQALEEEKLTFEDSARLQRAYRAALDTYTYLKV